MKKPIIAAALAGVLALTGSATAQNFPTHPVTMVIPFAAAGRRTPSAASSRSAWANCSARPW